MTTNWARFTRQLLSRSLLRNYS